MTPRVAVVHEWLLDYAGSERVVREILEVVPEADLFVLIDRRDEELRSAISAPPAPPASCSGCRARSSGCATTCR